MTRDELKYAAHVNLVKQRPGMGIAHATVPFVVDAMFGAVEDMTPDQRVEFFDLVAHGYCRHCGEVKSGVCHCWNDE